MLVEKVVEHRVEGVRQGWLECVPANEASVDRKRKWFTRWEVRGKATGTCGLASCLLPTLLKGRV
jgi:hypothetical protein